MFDVYLAPKKNAPGPVIVTVTGEDAAKTLVGALKSVQDSLFQCEGLKPWYQAVERGESAEAEPEPEEEAAPAETSTKE